MQSCHVALDAELWSGVELSRPLFVVAAPAVSRLSSSGQQRGSFCVGERDERPVERLAALVIERREEVVLDLVDDRAHPRELVPARRW